MSSTADLIHEGYEPWSPDMVRDHTFAAPSKRGRAYDAGEVDQYTARMGDEIEYLHGRLRDLAAQLQLARAGVELAATGELTVYSDVDEQALQVRMAAQEEADRIVAEAESMADDIVAEANHQANNIEDEAKPVVQWEGVDEPDTAAVFKIADELPHRVEAWERTGEHIVRDAQRLAQIAQDALSRVARSHESIALALAGGEPSPQQGAAQTMWGENDQLIPTPDPPG